MYIKAVLMSYMVNKNPMKSHDLSAIVTFLDTPNTWGWVKITYYHLTGGISIHRFFFPPGVLNGFDPEPHHITSDSTKTCQDTCRQGLCLGGWAGDIWQARVRFVGVCDIAIENDPFLVDFAISMVIFRGYVSLPEDMPIKAKILWPFRGFLY